MDDAELIRRFIAGQDNAFSTLIERHRRRVASVVAGVVGVEGRETVDDIVQEVFIRCAATLPSFRFESAFSTWLFRLAYNMAVDARRSERARHAREGRFAETRGRQRPDDQNGVRDAVNALPDVYRFVIHAHYWLGHTTAEIGELLGIPAGTVKTYLCRARAILAARVGERS